MSCYHRHCFSFKSLNNFVLVFLFIGPFLLKVFLRFDRSMILLLDSLDMNTLLLHRSNLLFKSASSFKTEEFFLEQCKRIIVSNAMKLHVQSILKHPD